MHKWDENVVEFLFVLHINQTLQSYQTHLLVLFGLATCISLLYESMAFRSKKMTERWIDLDGYVEGKGSVLFIWFESSEETMGLRLMGNAG